MEQLKKSIEIYQDTNFNDDNLIKTAALNILYFKKNRALKSPNDCAKLMQISNKLMNCSGGAGHKGGISSPDMKEESNTNKNNNNSNNNNKTLPQNPNLNVKFISIET